MNQIPNLNPNPNHNSPGYKTSEFYFTLIVVALAICAYIFGHLSDTSTVEVISYIVSVYSISRGVSKIGK